MTTAAEDIRTASNLLEEAGFQNFRWQAEVLMAHALSIKPGQLHLVKDRLISSSAGKNFFSLLKKRLSGIPLQHVIEEWDFYGRTFKVDSRALIPRPETELAVDIVVASELPPSPLIADVGTGSGIIGISLALELPGSTVKGTDVSPEALELAGENKVLLGASNYSTVNCNLTEGLKGPFDVIVANLPYIPSGEIPTLQPEVKYYDPPVALDGGEDGTLLILELVEEAPGKLKSGGLIVLETAYNQSDRVSSFFSENLWTDVRSVKDLAGKHRMITAYRR